MKESILPLIILFTIILSCETFDNSKDYNCIPATDDLFNPIELAISDYRSNVLRKEVKFSTTDSSICHIIYWKDEQKQIVAKNGRHRTEHSIILLNLERLSDYSFVIVKETDEGKIEKTEILSFKTQDLPEDISTYTFHSTSHYKKDCFEGYILTHQRALEKNILCILNGHGNIIWYEKLSKSPKVFNWTNRGTIICMLADKASLLLESDEILEINLYGDTLSNFVKSPESFEKGLHHDIMVNKTGNIYAIFYDYRIIDFSPQGYDITDTVFCDGLYELDKNGNILWEWSVFDWINPLEDPVLLKRRKDWLHANSIYEDYDQNILVSFRHNNQVWKIDRETGEILWKLGEDGDFELPDQSLFSGQHHINQSKTGELMLFDNNNEKSRSRVLFFSVDENLKTARMTRETVLPDYYYSYIMGSAYETSCNNLLINSTSGGAISLVDYDGTVIWEIGTSTYPYRSVLIENLNYNYEYCR